MITIQSAMLVILGFLVASLLGLLVASAFWARAVRLTTQRLKQSLPVSEPEIKADRDRLKAEYAIKVHKLETGLDQAKLQRARQLIEINRREASISSLETDVVGLKADLEENQNARCVLEQTVADRLPKVEARLAEAKRLLFNRDREIAELMHGAKKHKSALEDASSLNAQKNVQIERLNTALSTRGRRSTGEPRFEGEPALRTEIETLRTKTREQATLIDRLQRRLGFGYAMPAPLAASAGEAGGDIERLRQDLSEAESVLNAVRAGTPPAAAGAAGRAEYEREIRGLRAKAEDQAGEIARLKAALSTFEQQDDKAGKVGGLKDSKIALKARLGSAQAQADHQSATISRLRAELAATHERLARQAAHFMDEMRRVGSGSASTAGRRAARGAERASLVERVTQARLAIAAAPQPRAGETANGSDTTPANGRDTKPEAAAVTGAAAPPEAAAAAPPAAAPAAESPQAVPIPAKGRKPRLLDRITGLAKS